MPKILPTETSVVRAEWMPIVEQCAAQRGLPDGLPSVEDELGPGKWLVVPSNKRKDGLVYHCLYWVERPSYRRHRVGTFYLEAERAAHIKNRGERRVGKLLAGHTPDGDKLVRVKSQNGHDDWLVTVHLDARGLPVLRPVQCEAGGEARR